MAGTTLLVVEDDPGMCSQYRWAFPGHHVLVAHDRRAALAVAARERPPLALLDLGLPPDPDGVAEGFATLESLLAQDRDMKVVVATSHGERGHALRAVALGACDFCEKPVEVELLRVVVERAARLHALEAENRRLAARLPEASLKGIVTASDSMLKVCRTIERLAGTSITVLLMGESGTGKEALARALHDRGARAQGPFVALNCGAIPETLLESELFGYERGAFTGAFARSLGKIESAHKGTLFLDEIGDLPQPLQVKLLRFLQEQTIERIGGRHAIAVDVRVVSATNADLERQVEQGRFRSDLYYRLNAVTLRVPPLREREGDAQLLARYFLARFNREYGRDLKGFGDGAIRAIAGHGWPGNVRELENRMKRAVVMADGRAIEAADMELAADDAALPDLDIRAARARAEREVLQAAMARGGGTVSVAAKLLGVSRPTLYGLLQQHGFADGAAAVVAGPDSPPPTDEVSGPAGPRARRNGAIGT